MELSRRRFLKAAGAGALPLAVAGCGGFSTSSSSSKAGSDTLTFTTWGTDAELTGFKDVITRFEKANSGSKVSLNSVPYEQMFTNIDAQIQAGDPPDIFRVPYYSFGRYAGAGQLLDLSKHLPSGFSSRFTPAAWAAVQNQSTPFGVPHHTDTSVILYNKDAFDSAGIDSVPTSLDDAWTWDEFTAVSQKLRKALPAKKYPFAYNWQGNGVTRWLDWLFEVNGRFLNTDLTKSAIDSDAGREAVEFTQSFYSRKFSPANSSVKSTTYAADTWYAGTVPMTWSGAFLIPDATQTLKFEWGAIPSPRKERAASDFGGNALVATAGTKKAELAASFLDFITGEQSMRDFCELASLLPTRRDLVADGIKFKVRPELSPTFIAQASTVRASDSGQVASPHMSEIITVLQDQLDQAFVGGQGVDKTVTNLASGIDRAVSS